METLLPGGDFQARTICGVANKIIIYTNIAGQIVKTIKFLATSRLQHACDLQKTGVLEYTAFYR